MQNDLSQSLYLEASPIDKNLFIAYKKIGERKGLTTCLPVAQILINSGPEPIIKFHQNPVLSDEEKDFIKAKSGELLPNFLLTEWLSEKKLLIVTVSFYIILAIFLKILYNVFIF